MSDKISRKDLLRGVFSFFRDVGEKATPALRLLPEYLVRPPGAVQPDDAYLAACTGCEACVEACLPAVVQMAEVEGRRVAVLQPDRKPCRLCADLPCIAACKDGALQHPGSIRQVHLGIAQVDPRICRTFRREECDLCYRYCPFPEEAIRRVNSRPVVMSSACTGCGICATICPDRAIEIVPERDLVPGMRIPRDIHRTRRRPAG